MKESVMNTSWSFAPKSEKLILVTVGCDVRHTLSCMSCNRSLMRLSVKADSKTRWYHGNNDSSLCIIRTSFLRVGKDCVRLHIGVNLCLHKSSLLYVGIGRLPATEAKQSGDEVSEHAIRRRRKSACRLPATEAKQSGDEVSERAIRRGGRSQRRK